MRSIREDQHGTNTGYGYGCRCLSCKDARSAYNAAYYQRIREATARNYTDEPSRSDTHPRPSITPDGKRFSVTCPCGFWDIEMTRRAAEYSVVRHVKSRINRAT